LLSKSERATGGVDRLQPFFIPASSLSTWNRKCANFWENDSPMDIGGLWLFGVEGGLTREFWAVFEENIFGGA
jgi:hypothetical protein